MGQSLSFLSDGHVMPRSCPLHSQAPHFPEVQSTKPCLPPRMSQTSKLATHQQMTVEEDWEAALTITAPRGLSPFPAYTPRTPRTRHKSLSAGFAEEDERGF